MESACRSHLSTPFTLAGVRLDEALLIAAEGLISNVQGHQPCVVTEAGLLLRVFVCHSTTSGVNGVENMSGSDVCSPREQFSHFSLWAKASWVADKSTDTPAKIR